MMGKSVFSWVKVYLLLVLFMFAVEANGTVDLVDGGVYYVSTAHEDYFVTGNSTLNVNAGANVEYITGWLQSYINMYGGYVKFLISYSSYGILDRPYDTIVYGGHIYGLNAVHTGHFTLNNGLVDRASVCNGATGIINGGEIVQDLICDTIGTAYINDGKIGSIVTEYNYEGVININGGEIHDIYGKTETCGGTIYINGEGFNYPYGVIPDKTGVITGTLSNGDIINATFLIEGNTSIVLVPEPSICLFLMTGGICSLLYKQRKQLNGAR